MDNEKLLLSTKLHWIIYFDVALCIILPFIIILTSKNASTTQLAQVTFFLGLLLVVIRYMTQRTTEFAITNKRLIVKRGVFKARSQACNLNRISNVKLRQGIVAKVLKCGSVEIKDKGGAIFKLRNMKNAEAFSKLLGSKISTSGR